MTVARFGHNKRVQTQSRPRKTKMRISGAKTGIFSIFGDVLGQTDVRQRRRIYGEISTSQGCWKASFFGLVDSFAESIGGVVLQKDSASLS